MILFFTLYFSILFAAYVLVKNTKPSRGDLMLNINGQPLMLKGMTPQTPSEAAAVIELAIEFAQQELASEFAQQERNTRGCFVPRIVRE